MRLSNICARCQPPTRTHPAFLTLSNPQALIANPFRNLCCAFHPSSTYPLPKQQIRKRAFDSAVQQNQGSQLFSSSERSCRHTPTFVSGSKRAFIFFRFMSTKPYVHVNKSRNTTALLTHSANFMTEVRKTSFRTMRPGD